MVADINNYCSLHCCLLAKRCMQADIGDLQATQKTNKIFSKYVDEISSINMSTTNLVNEYMLSMQ